MSKNDEIARVLMSKRTVENSPKKVVSEWPDDKEFNLKDWSLEAVKSLHGDKPDPVLLQEFLKHEPWVLMSVTRNSIKLEQPDYVNLDTKLKE